MNKKSLLVMVILSAVQLSCTAASNIPVKINKSAFPGFSISPSNVELMGYKFTLDSLEKVEMPNCKKALNYDISKIAEYNYFRFKLLLTSCKALNKYAEAKESNKSFFPVTLTDANYKNFPALSVPFLSKTEYKQRENKTIKQVFKKIKVSSKNNSATIITSEDEIYFTVLSRGDFNNDKIEDLLVSSEWYAKNANGKHTDLVILSKTGKNKAIKIDWRMKFKR